MQGDIKFGFGSVVISIFTISIFSSSSLATSNDVELGMASKYLFPSNADIYSLT